MITEIQDTISVGVVFAAGVVKPNWFIWRGRKYQVKTITMRWYTREGRSHILHLSMSDGSTLFELTFNQSSLVWKLVAVDTSASGT